MSIIVDQIIICFKMLTLIQKNTSIQEKKQQKLTALFQNIVNFIKQSYYHSIYKIKLFKYCNICKISMTANYLPLLIVLFAFAFADQTSLADQSKVLANINIYHQKYETGMQKIFQFCDVKLPRQLNNNEFKENYLSAADHKKNRFIQMMIQIRNQHANQKKLQQAKQFQAYIRQIEYLKTLSQWLKVFTGRYQLMFWISSFTFLAYATNRNSHLQIVAKIARGMIVQILIIYIYVKYFEDNNFNEAFYIVFIESQSLQLLTKLLNNRHQRRQIFTKIIFSKQKGKQPILETINLIDLAKQINDRYSICWTTYSYEDIVQLSNKEGKKQSQHFVVQTACNHYFHWICLKQWMDLGNNKCPLDNSPIQKFDPIDFIN